MSFYGTIYNQISNAFETFYIKNSGKNINTAPSTNETVKIKADGREGEFTVDTGNKWIALSGNSDGNYCKIYHNVPDNVNNSTIIKIVNSLEKLPSGKEYISVKLDNDSFLEVKNPYYDKNGHIAGVDSQYIKFHQVNAKAEMEDMREDIANFENSVDVALNDFHDRLIEQQEFEGRIKELEDIEADTQLEKINDFIGDYTDFTNEEDVTLCGAFGNIDYLRNSGKDNMGRLRLKDSFSDFDRADGTICDYLNVLYEECKNNAAVGNKVVNLIDRIDVIEQKLKELEEQI